MYEVKPKMGKLHKVIDMIRVLNPNNSCKTCKYSYLSPTTCADKEYDYICDDCTRCYCCQNAPEDEITCPYYQEWENNIEAD